MSYAKKFDFKTDDSEGVFIPIPSNGNLTVDLDGMLRTMLRGHFYWEFYDKDSDGNFESANPTAGTIRFQWRPDDKSVWNETSAGELQAASATEIPKADTSYTEARMVLSGIVGAEYVRAYLYRWGGEA